MFGEARRRSVSQAAFRIQRLTLDDQLERLLLRVKEQVARIRLAHATGQSHHA
jgi:hypothetical protein